MTAGSVETARPSAHTMRRWGWRLALFVPFPIVLGATSGVLFWGDLTASDSEEFAGLVVFLLALTIIGILDACAVDWRTGSDNLWVFFFVHFVLIFLYMLGAFAPFVLGLGDLALSDIQEPVTECCGDNADENLWGVFLTYFVLALSISLFLIPVGSLALVIWRFLFRVRTQ